MALKVYYLTDQGIGALYVRRRPRVRLEPLFSGGGQERGLRSGTVPTPLCVGLGEAAKIAEEEMSVCITYSRFTWMMISSYACLINNDD